VAPATGAGAKQGAAWEAILGKPQSAAWGLSGNAWTGGVDGRAVRR